jgi:hypothetical protein
MLAYDPEHKKTAQGQKKYLFRFELEGRHVPEVLITKKVGTGTRKEFAGSLTRRQYERFIRFYFAVLTDEGYDPSHDRYIQRMEARRERETRREKAANPRGKRG